MIPRRLIGRVSPIDISFNQEKLVKSGERISARHIRRIESSKIKYLEFPEEAMLGQVLASDVIDKKTGEITIAANSVIDDELLEKIKELDLKGGL